MLRLVWFSIGRKRRHWWSRLENWELTILGHQNLGQNTSHSRPLQITLVLSMTSFIFVLLIGWTAWPCLQRHWHHLLQALEHYCFLLLFIRFLFSQTFNKNKLEMNTLKFAQLLSKPSWLTCPCGSRVLISRCNKGRFAIGGKCQPCRETVCAFASVHTGFQRPRVKEYLFPIFKIEWKSKFLFSFSFYKNDAYSTCKCHYL